MPNGKLGPKPKKRAKKKAAAKRPYVRKTRATRAEFNARRLDEQRVPKGGFGFTEGGEERQYASAEDVRLNSLKLPTVRKPENQIKVGRPTLYRPEYPQLLVDYFTATLEEIPEVQVEVVPSLKFVQKPVVLPLLSTFASRLGTHRGTVWDWGVKHPEFSDAIEIAKEIQEEILLRMASHGGYAPGISTFMLKNLQDWKDKSEVDVTATAPNLNFDLQDKGA